MYRNFNLYFRSADGYGKVLYFRDSFLKALLQRYVSLKHSAEYSTVDLNLNVQSGAHKNVMQLIQFVVLTRLNFVRRSMSILLMFFRIDRWKRSDGGRSIHSPIESFFLRKQSDWRKRRAFCGGGFREPLWSITYYTI